MAPNSRDTQVLNAEEYLSFLIQTLFDVSVSHNRFTDFVEDIIDLLDHLCNESDAEFERYAALVRNAHRAGFSDTQGKVLYLQLLYVEAHHTFASSRASLKFRSLNLFAAPESHLMLRSQEWLEHIVGTLSRVDGGEVAMCEFLASRLIGLAQKLHLDAGEVLQQPNVAFNVSDEMVDSWVAQNPDVQERLRQFGL